MEFKALLSIVDSAFIALLGESMTYTPGSGDPVTVRGIFDNLSEHVNVEYSGVSSNGPMVTLQLADLPDDPSTATDLPTLTIREVEYEVREVKPDGQGVVKLLLHRVT